MLCFSYRLRKMITLTTFKHFENGPPIMHLVCCVRQTKRESKFAFVAGKIEINRLVFQSSWRKHGKSAGKLSWGGGGD